MSLTHLDNQINIPSVNLEEKKPVHFGTSLDFLYCRLRIWGDICPGKDQEVPGKDQKVPGTVQEV